jgi:hypothetical protein
MTTSKNAMNFTMEGGSEIQKMTKSYRKRPRSKLSINITVNHQPKDSLLNTCKVRS